MASARKPTSRRTCCMIAAVVLGVIAAICIVITLHMRARMTTDPADARLLEVTMAPSLDKWLGSLDAQVAEHEPGITDRIQDDWPSGARLTLVRIRLPVRSMRPIPGRVGYYQVSAWDCTVVSPSGQEHEGLATVGRSRGGRRLSPTFGTKERLPFRSGAFGIDVIFALPAEELPGTFAIRFRGKQCDEVELPAGGGSTDVEVVWRR